METNYFLAEWLCSGDTYMVLLNVLDEGWVIKLCRVMAVGRQVAARHMIFETIIYSEGFFWLTNQYCKVEDR